MRKKIDKYIEIVVSSNPKLSSMSEKSRNMILSVLKRHYYKAGITVVNNQSDLFKLISKSPDIAFIGVKKLPTFDGSSDYIWMAEQLEENGIITTGSGSDAIKLEQDKTKAKDAVINAGLNSSPYFIATNNQYYNEDILPLKFPLFLKPPDRGAGVGIDQYSVVRNFEQFKAKVNSLHRENNSESMAEEYLSGREFTVAVLKDFDTEQLLALPIEQLPVQNTQGDKLIGHEMKESSTETAVSLVNDLDIKEAVSQLAIQVFEALGARDYGRIDIRLDSSGKPNFLEANLIPGLINGSGNFQKACQMNLNMNYESMILRIVELASSRCTNADLADEEFYDSELNSLTPIHTT